MPNKPTADELALMSDLEQVVGTPDQVTARIALAQECAPLDAQRTLAEQLRGQQVLLRNLKDRYDVPTIARNELARQFDPDYVPPPNYGEGRRISAEERQRRDEHRKKHVVNWSKLDGD